MALKLVHQSKSELARCSLNWFSAAAFTRLSQRVIIVLVAAALTVPALVAQKVELSVAVRSWIIDIILRFKDFGLR